MKKLLSVVCLLSVAAFAGEKYLGTLIPTGGVSCNTDTLWTFGSTDGGSAVSSPTKRNNGLIQADAGFVDGGFDVPIMAKITVQCQNLDGGSASSYVCVNVATCSAQKGVLLTSPSDALPTSVNTTTAARETLTGDARSALVCIYSAEQNSCFVGQRTGTEFEAK